MLATQVDYWKLVESRRHNKRDEELSEMANVENIRHNKELETEAQRHNQAQEFLTSVQLNEAQRHNVAGENISYATISENKRHNLESEGVNWYSAQSGAVKDVATKSQAILSDVNARTTPISTIGNLFGTVFKTASIVF